MRDLLGDRPVEVARVRTRHEGAVQLDLEVDVKGPRRLAKVRHRLGLLSARGHAAASSLSGTTQREIDVANDLPRNGPSGWYSQAWMSRADQSLTSTAPNTWSSARPTGTGSPSLLGTPITKPASSSMSSRSLGPKVGPGRCPRGRRT